MILKNNSTRLLLFCVFLLASIACGNAPPSPPASQAAAPQADSASAASPAPAAAQADGAAKEPASDLDTFDNPVADKLVGKWTGDLDGMIERKVIRVLTVYSKTTFFVDKGAQMGMVADAFRLFEDNLNKRLNNKNVRVKVDVRAGRGRRSHPGAPRGPRRHRRRGQADHGVAQGEGGLHQVPHAAASRPSS